MARPLRNKVDYFPHPVTHGKKMSYLEKKYGNDGYAVWFKILEEIGNTDFHYLNLSDEVQIMFLSDRCLVDENVLLSIISDLVKLNEFDKTLWDENRILFNEKFIETINDAYKKRSNKCIDKKSLLELLHSLGVRKQNKSIIKPEKGNPIYSENTQSKVKDSKEEETIYGLNDFLKDWNETRSTVTRMPSHLNRIGSSEQMEQFNELSNSYKQEDFVNAMKGLFKQEKFPKGMSAMQSTPKHFLGHFELYLTAYHDKNKNVWGE